MTKFVPKTGQIDYTNVHHVPVVNCVVVYMGKILILYRSSEVGFYPNCWHGVAGFLDDKKSVVEKIREEIKEELGIREEQIVSINEGEILEKEAPEYVKTWIVHTAKAELSTNQVRLDWESSDFRWIYPNELRNYQVLPGFEKVVSQFFALN